jgi:hypothetical protein
LSSLDVVGSIEKLEREREREREKERERERNNKLLPERSLVSFFAQLG